MSTQLLEATTLWSLLEARAALTPEAPMLIDGQRGLRFFPTLVRRVARGFRNFGNYRLRALLAAGGHRPWRKTPTHAHL